MGTITAVTFDLWQTLLLDRPEVGRLRTQARLDGARDALLKAGEAHDEERIRTAYQDCARRCQAIREGLTDISFQEQVEIFIDGISPGLALRIPESTRREIAASYSDSFFVYPPIPHPEGVQTLRSVKEMGLRLGLISNTGMTPGVSFRRFLGEHGMLEFFDTLTFSDEVRLAKPAGEIFLMTLRAIGATPSQSIHVGDHFDTDVRGAQRCGLKTVWIEGFYARPDPADSSADPDVTVPELGQAVLAIRELAAGNLSVEPA